MSPFDPKGLTRRNFLIKVGSSTFALPFLPSLLSKQLLAAGTSGTPKRLIVVQLNHGMHPKQWFPYIPMGIPSPSQVNESTPAYKNVPYVMKGTDHYEISLNAIAGDYSPVLGSKFTALKDKLLFVTGLDGVETLGLSGTDVHNRSMLLGHLRANDGTALGESIDQLIARSLPATKVPSLHISLMPGNGDSISYKSSANGFVKEPAYHSDSAVFNLLFSNFSPTGTPPPSPPTIDKTIVDSANAQLNSLMSNPRLSQADRQRLQAHIDAMHELEKGFAVVVPQPTGQCVIPSLVSGSTFDIYCKNQMKNIASAIKCGLTNVVTISAPDGDKNIEALNFMNGKPSSFNKDYHNDCHEHIYNANTEPVKRFFLNHIADLIAELNTVENTTTGATYLDNTLLVIGTGIGGEPWDHRTNSQPLLIAGSCGGYFSTGRAVNLWQHSAGNYRGSLYGRGYSQFLFTMLDAFGIPGSIGNMKINQSFPSATQKYSGQGLSVLPGMKA